MKIGLLVYPNCIISGLFAFSDILSVTNKRTGKPIFEFSWAGINNKDVEIASHIGEATTVIKPQCLISDPSLDAILIPGFWTSTETDLSYHLKQNQNLISAIKKLPIRVNIYSYCTSVSLVAASGKLNKHQATSTWWLADYLQKKFTEIEWLFSQSYISDTNIDTASGVNGYLQIAQSLIKKMHSETVLREIQDLMVLAKPEPQVQPFKIINIMKIDNDLIRKIYLWVENTAARDIGIELLAQYLNMTSRTLSRKVKILTDLSCSQFLRIVKMHQASEYLIHSTQGVSAISNMLGFSDDVSFRRSFKNITQYTPSKYRQLFKR